MGMPKILVTRPLQDFERTANALELLGFEAVHVPMMRFEPLTFKAPKLRGYAALVFTSANGLRAIENSERYRQLPCYVVGETTKKMAVGRGFEVLAVGDGDVESLCDAIKNDYLARGLETPLLHISGVHMAGKLAIRLAELSIASERLQAYEMVEIANIDAETLRVLEAEEIDGMLFYSARSAKIFIENMKKDGILQKISEIPAFCLSKNIADGVCKPYLKHIYFTNQPDETDLLNLVQIKLNIYPSE